MWTNQSLKKRASPNSHFGGVMKSRDFEVYTRNQMIMNLSILAVVATSAIAVMLLLSSSPI